MSDGARGATAKAAMNASRPKVARAALPAPAFGSEPFALRALQAAAGNHAVSQMLGTGSPLQAELRAEMETRFGADFRSVRVHDGSQARSSAATLEANAYTRGNDIVFNSGQFAPWSSGGKQLLAHELAHVVQQRRGGAAPALDASASHEQGADAAASAFSSGAGPVAVQGATAVGVARDAQKKPSATFYLNAFGGNRGFYWGSFGAKIPDWPVDPGLKALWAKIPVNPKKGSEVDGVDPRAIASSPELIEFVDSVRAFQHENMEPVDPSWEGTVNVATAQKLRAREDARARPRKEVISTPAKKAPDFSFSGQAVTSGSVSGTANVGMSITDRALGALSDPSGAVGSLASQVFSTDRLKAMLVDTLIRSLGLPPTGARLAMAVGRGIADQMVTELIKEGKGAQLLKHLKDFSAPDIGELMKGYYIGLVEGLVSPITDLFGILVLGEHVNKMGKDLLVSAFNNRNQVGAEFQAFMDEAGIVKGKFADFWKDVKAHPQQALIALLNAPDALSAFAEQKAYELGKTGGSSIVASLESPWKPPQKEEQAPDVLETPAAYVEHMAKKAEDYVIDTPWAKIGSKAGYAIGFVAIQAVLIAFTEGIGNAVEEVGAVMGKIASALGKVSKGAGLMVARVAEFVATIGKGIAVVEEAIALLVGKALKPLEKFLEPILEPIGKMFTKLRAFLRKLFGVAEKEGAALVDAAAGKGTKLLGAGEPPPVVPPTPPPEVHPDVLPFKRDVKPPVSDASQKLEQNIAKQSPDKANTVTKLEPKKTPPPNTEPNVAAKPQVLEDEVPVARKMASGDNRGLPADRDAPRASLGDQGGGGKKPPLKTDAPPPAGSTGASPKGPVKSPGAPPKGRGNLPAPIELSNAKAPLAERAAFVRRNRNLLGPNQRAQLDALNGKTPSASQLKLWEQRVDQGLRAAQGDKVASAIGAKPGSVGTARRPRSGPRSGGYEWEETHAGLSGEPANEVTHSVRTDTDQAQFDSLGAPGGEVQPKELKSYDKPPTDYTPPRYVPSDAYGRMVANNSEATKGLEKMLARQEDRLWKAHEFADQMERQARIARDLGWPPVEWPMHAQVVEDYFTSEVLPLVPRDLREKIRLVPEHFFD
jgi:Domain of unknown function (DUF4157)